MKQMYKVFIKDKEVLFTNSSNTLSAGAQYDELVYKKENGILAAIDKAQSAFLKITAKDVDKLFNDFKKEFTLIEAAGGLVQNNKKEYLLIFRKGKWDLPKGKIEKKEKTEAAAIREVEEECGITGLTILEKLPDTFHVYKLKGKQVLKQTHWLKMKSEYEGKLQPQLEEDITEVKWMDKEGIKTAMQNTYPLIKEILMHL